MKKTFQNFNPISGEVETMTINPSVPTPDYVNHPPHYQTKSGLETIDVIEAFTENLHGIEATDTGNIIKYACRWKEKGGVEDLKKIVWYAKHLINHLEKDDIGTVLEPIENAGKCGRPDIRWEAD